MNFNNTTDIQFASHSLSTSSWKHAMADAVVLCSSILLTPQREINKHIYAHIYMKKYAKTWDKNVI